MNEQDKKRIKDMEQLILDAKHASCAEIKEKNIACGGALRVYKSSPAWCTVQIRSTGAINPSGGKTRKMYSSTPISLEEAKLVIAKLQEFVDGEK